MRARSTTLALVVAFALPTVAFAQQPEKKPEAPKPEQPKAEQPKAEQPKTEQAKPDSARAGAAAAVSVETKVAGDVSVASATQVLGAVSEAGAAPAALSAATLTEVRVVNSAEVLDPAGGAALGLLLTKHAADVAKLRQATALNAQIKAALTTANVPNDRVIGVALNGSVATVFVK
ncbi:MAG TPA: hypothetical protein VEA99_08685 [Gemmatimonadaceae bacterium]|nr:hypothetical protein [Gemmatimonadaceae bacterium]